MLNIKPVSDLRNYNKVLEQVTTDEPVFLTKNGHGKYVVVTIEEYDRLKKSLEIVEKLKKAEESGTISLSEAKQRFGI
ncbi:type II toxin-antitoxin system prevent-host-death family antitoxin [Enterococcus sp. AZ196]|uniref:type II toxin-antitoxin system prevent-host-death family antitoxin n=1 Tax=Enterococcus sp. AZ196 TaxID=2774659 RepID=UPI003D2A3A73